MDSQKHSQRRPKIILKFKNPSAPMEQNKDDYQIGEENFGDGYLQFGAYGAVDGSTKSKKTESAAVEGEMMSSPYYCQVDNCAADLSLAKRYHRRHKVCEVHAKAPVVLVARLRQRFCQQCSRFHELSEFDEARRSCRNRLACHNERRRKSSSDVAQVDVDGSSRLRMKRNQQRQVSQRGRAPEPPHGEQFQIRWDHLE